MRARSLYKAPASFRVAADWVTFACDRHSARGYLAAPRGCMLFGAVIAAPDEAGVSEHLQERARLLAAQGFITLTIDLFCDEAERAETAIPALEGGFDYLASRLDVDAECIGALGYGRGGDAVLAWSNLRNKLACAVAFYAPPQSHVSAASELRTTCPMQLHFWEEDEAVPFADALALRQSLERDGERSVEFHSYPGARCSDLDLAAEVNLSEEGALALRRVTKFFRRYLGDWSTA